MWERAVTARLLNVMCGTTAFHPWNVGALPDVDVMRLMQEVETEREVREWKAAVRGK
jgi:hypothetical protein